MGYKQHLNFHTLLLKQRKILTNYKKLIVVNSFSRNKYPTPQKPKTIFYIVGRYKIIEQLNSQKYICFTKRRFGLFKIKNVKDKVVKKQLFFLSNFIRNKNFSRHINYLPKHKKTKIIFYKKFNKLFFRSARSLFITYFNLKKTQTQSLISKRISSVIKNNWSKRLESNDVVTLLLNSNLFYSYRDAVSFIENFGVQIDNKIIYQPNIKFYKFTRFSLVFNKNILTFFKKNRQKVIHSLKNIKFYKLRSKLVLSRFKSMWIPSSEWVTEHCFLYLHKNITVEFDFRSLTGILIYDPKLLQLNNYMINYNISLYMSRSYNWKYII